MSSSPTTSASGDTGPQAVIRAESRFRIAWDAVALLLGCASCWIVLYQVSFLHSSDAAGSALIYLIDLYFFIDLLLNFRTTYREQGIEIERREAIGKHYLRTLFFFDLLGLLPIDAIFLAMPDAAAGGIPLLLLLRQTRLLRIPRLFLILRRWERSIRTNSGYLRIGRLALIVFLLTHLIACAWFFVPFAEHFPPDSWPISEGIAGAGPFIQYIRSYYWAVVTMTTVGYGDITPHRTLEYVFAIFVMGAGASLYAFVIGNIASLFSNLDASKVRFWNRADAAIQFLRARRAPARLNEQLRSYYEYMWDRYRGMGEQAMFEELPATLRLEILLHLTKELQATVPLFRRSGEILRDALLLALRPYVYTPGTLIAREGEPGRELFFISRGTVAVTSGQDTKAHGTLVSGEYFGDLSMMLGERRTASARAVTHCEIFVLGIAEFEQLKKDHPEFREVLKSVSSDKSERLAALVVEGAIL